MLTYSFKTFCSDRCIRSKFLYSISDFSIISLFHSAKTTRLQDEVKAGSSRPGFFTYSRCDSPDWALVKTQGIRHTRGKPYHPMTQGKIERYHRSMKSLLLLEHNYSPSKLGHQIRRFVSYYNNYRYHEALNHVTAVDVYYGKDREILSRREQIKKKPCCYAKDTIAL